MTLDVLVECLDDIAADVAAGRWEHAFHAYADLVDEAAHLASGEPGSVEPAPDAKSRVHDSLKRLFAACPGSDPGAVKWTADDVWLFAHSVRLFARRVLAG